MTPQNGVVYYVYGGSYNTFDAAAKSALESGIRSVAWIQYQNGVAVAEGGDCVDDNCHCCKHWVRWSKDNDS